MTRKQFIKKLKIFKSIDPEEMEDVIDYYNEYLDDANIYEDDEVPEGMDPKDCRIIYSQTLNLQEKILKIHLKYLE